MVAIAILLYCPGLIVACQIHALQGWMSKLVAGNLCSQFRDSGGLWCAACRRSAELVWLLYAQALYFAYFCADAILYPNGVGLNLYQKGDWLMKNIIFALFAFTVVVRSSGEYVRSGTWIMSISRHA